MSANPEKMVKSPDILEKVKQELSEDITISMGQWKTIEIKGKKKYVTKIVESTMEKRRIYYLFWKANRRLQWSYIKSLNQYEKIQILKENLPENEMIV